MSSIDQQFIEYIVKSLVGKPDAVEIERTIDEKGVLIELTVDPVDLGRVIGKRGATDQSLRTLLRALGTKNDARYNLKIVDNGEDRPVSEKPAKKAEAKSDDSVPAADDTSSDDTSVADDVVSDEDDEPEEENERLKNTRKELADLDDLDIQ